MDEDKLNAEISKRNKKIARKTYDDGMGLAEELLTEQGELPDADLFFEIVKDSAKKAEEVEGNLSNKRKTN